MTNHGTFSTPAAVCVCIDDASIIALYPNDANDNDAIQQQQKQTMTPPDLTIQQPSGTVPRRSSDGSSIDGTVRRYSHSPYGFDVVGSSSSSHTASVASRAASDVASDNGSISHIDDIQPAPNHPTMYPESYNNSFAGTLLSHNIAMHRRSSSSLSRSPGAVTPVPVLPISPVAPMTSPLSQQPQQQQSEASLLAAALQRGGAEGLPLLVGRIPNIAVTAKGSTFLQAMLDKHTDIALPIIYSEVTPELRRLFAHKYASYVVKKVLQKLDPVSSAEMVSNLVRDDVLLLHLCTSDLHARRMFQFLLTEVRGTSAALFEFICRHVFQVAFHEEGCVAIQRVLDHCPAQEREQFFSFVRSSLHSFCFDANASFVVQYMLDYGSQHLTAEAFASQFHGHFVTGLLTHPHGAKVAERLVTRIAPIRMMIVDELIRCPQARMMAVTHHDAGCYALTAIAREGTDQEAELLRQYVVPTVVAYNNSNGNGSFKQRKMMNGHNSNGLLPTAASRFVDAVVRRVATNGHRVASF